MSSLSFTWGRAGGIAQNSQKKRIKIREQYDVPESATQLVLDQNETVSQPELGSRNEEETGKAE
jgi:hypothetical protein